jgi:hypothetical protein
MNNKEYSILPDKNCELLEFTTETAGFFVISLVASGKMKKAEEICNISEHSVKGVSAKGIKITDKAITDIGYKKNLSK